MDFPKAVIFDMDGLMFDSEKITHEAWCRVGEHRGFHLTEEQFNTLRGITEKDILEKMKVLFGADKPVQVWREDVKALKWKIIEEKQTVYKMKGLVELLTFLQERKIPMAVASSNERVCIEKYMALEQVEDYFQTVISGEEVVKGKPDPEVFLTACQKLEVSPENALVLEDSYNGVKAAINGGIPVFWVYNTKETEQYDLQPTKRFDDLEQVMKYLRELCTE